MVVHCTSHSPAFSCLIDGPLCLTDVARQSTQAGERHLSRAAISSHFLLSHDREGGIMRARETREKEWICHFQSANVSDFFYFFYFFYELVKTATGWHLVEISQRIHEIKVTDDQVYVPSEGRFLLWKASPQGFLEAQCASQVQHPSIVTLEGRWDMINTQRATDLHLFKAQEKKSNTAILRGREWGQSSRNKDDHATEEGWNCIHKLTRRMRKS